MVDGQQELRTSAPDIKHVERGDTPSWPEVLGRDNSGSYVYLVPRNRLQPGQLDLKDMEFARRLMEAGAIKVAAPTGDGREEVTEAVARLIQTAQAPGSGRVVSTAVIDSLSGLPKQIITRIRDGHIELVLPGLPELGNLQGFPRYVVNRSVQGETLAAASQSGEVHFDLQSSLERLGVKDPMKYLLGSAFQDLARRTMRMGYLERCKQAIEIVTARNPEAQAPRMASIDPRNEEFFEQLVDLLDPREIEMLAESVTLDKVVGSLGTERKEDGFKVSVDMVLARLPVSFGAAAREMKGSFDEMGPFSVTVKAEPLFSVGQTQQDILGVRQRAVAFVEQAGFGESAHLVRK